MTIGDSRPLAPCPSSGKITFQQIGAIREVSSEIQMDDARLLPCRAMVGKNKEDGKGELDTYGNRVYVHPEPTNDPVDYYNALWGHDASSLFASESNQQMNELGKWYVENEFYSTNEPDPDSWIPALQEAVAVDRDGEQCIRMAAAPAQYFAGVDNLGQAVWNFIEADVTVKNYVGRLPAGEVFTIYWEWKQDNTQWWDVDPTMKVFGWSGGYKGSEVVETLLEKSHRGGEWRSSRYTFTVPENGFNDIWLEYQQKSPDSRADYTRSIFKNVQIWRA
jgi:hypothetical protein